jgi:hypothetical protein
VRPTPENLSRLRRWLLPEFYHLHLTVLNKQPTRKERLDQLKKVCEAASTLHSSLTRLNNVWLDLPWDLMAPAEGAVEGITDPFIATLQRLTDAAASRMEELALKKSPTGRPAKNVPFRQLTPRLIRIYEGLMKEPAGHPNWLPDSGMYGRKGSFYPFALAIWRCLRDNLPAEALVAIPSTEGGLAEELKKHWPEDSV